MDANQPTVSSDQRLLALVQQALADIAEGVTLDLDALCADAPTLRDAVAETLGLASHLPRLQQTARQHGVLAGTVLADRYELRQRLGAGAMGVVYAAHDHELDREVAVKLLHAGLAFDAARRQRFLREAETLAAVQDDHVVPIYDRGESEQGLLFLVMPRLAGRAMWDLLQERRASVAPGDWLRRPWRLSEHGIDAASGETDFARIAVGWVADLARGLAAAHRAGLVHRDVKPSNAFVREDGRAVLLDFGLAKADGDASLSGGSPVGTPFYMAPEQARGEPATEASDTYGLGATLYDLLAGQPPFGDTPERVLARLLRDAPVPILRLQEGLHRDLAAIVERAMEFAPARRYPTVGHFCADLSAVLDRRQVAARPIGALGRLWRSARRHPARAASVAAAGVALSVVVPFTSLSLDVRAAERDRRVLAHAAQLGMRAPFVGSPGRRGEVETAERQRNLDALDAILALTPDDVPMRVRRAALLSDRGADGDAARAAADAAHVARARPDSTLFAELARAYRGVVETGGGDPLAVVSLTVEPRTPDERFAATLHFIRRQKDATDPRACRRWLDPVLADSRACRELCGMVFVFEIVRARIGGDMGRHRERARAALAHATSLDREYGVPSQRGRSLAAFARLELDDFAGAVELLRAAVRRAPGEHGDLLHLGIAHRRLGQLDQARSALRAAHGLRPELANTMYELAEVEQERDDLAAALEWAERIPPASRLRGLAIGHVRMREGLSQLRAGDPAAADAAFAAAEAVLGATPGAASGVLRRRVAALRSGRSIEAFVLLADAVRQRVTSPQALTQLAEQMPEVLDASGVAAMRAVLRDLASHLSPDEPAPQPDSSLPAPQEK